MRLNERHLMQLAAVIDAGGVSEGALMLGLTQPAVSRSLSMLEARLGEPLFVRSRRSLHPTPLAAQLAAQGRIILSASRQASETVQGFVRGTKGVVRIGGLPFFMDALISAIAGSFQSKEPQISIQQSYLNFPEAMVALDADQLDIGIVAVNEPVGQMNYDFIKLLPGRNIVAARAGHPLTLQRMISVQDFAAYPWVAPLPGSPLLSDLQVIHNSLGINDLNIRYAGGTLLSVMNFLNHTDALAVLPFSVVQATSDAFRIVALPLDIPQAERSIGILRRAKSQRRAAADRFTQHIQEVIQGLG